MVSKMYVIHDKAIMSFVEPQFCRSHGEAERNFKHAVNNPKAVHLHNNPEQFTLFYVGDYDETTGLVTPLAAPQSIITAIQCKSADNVREIGA